MASNLVPKFCFPHPSSAVSCLYSFHTSVEEHNDKKTLYYPTDAQIYNSYIQLELL